MLAHFISSFLARRNMSLEQIPSSSFVNTTFGVSYLLAVGSSTYESVEIQYRITSPTSNTSAISLSGTITVIPAVLIHCLTISIPSASCGRSHLCLRSYLQAVQWPYVAFSLSFTYSPAVMTSYIGGLSGDTQLGIGYTNLVNLRIP